MSYCEIGVEAQVLYTLNGVKKRYLTKQTPIDVTVAQLPSDTPSGGQIPGQDYQIRTIYYDDVLQRELIQSTTSNGASLPIYKGVISSAKIVIKQFSNYYIYLVVTDALQTQESPLGRTNGYNYNPENLYRIYDIKPFPDNGQQEPPSTDSKCEIRISHNGLLLYSDRGKCPIPFEVLCGEQCPEGTTKCFSTNYPGYCCLPCSEIKQEIKAIASQIRSLNNG